MREVERRRVYEVAGNPEGGSACGLAKKKNLLEAGFENGAPDRVRQAFAKHVSRAAERHVACAVAGNPEGG